MQFTPQQLAGGGRYSFKTKIGNWSEEKALEEIMLQDFLARKQSGTLLSLKERKRDLLVLTKVPHTFSADGILKFGDTIMLKNQNTDACLANNIFDKTQPVGETYSVSAAPTSSTSGADAVIEDVHNAPDDASVEQTCCVCFLGASDGQAMISIPCGHGLCALCAIRISKEECPMCRAPAHLTMLGYAQLDHDSSPERAELARLAEDAKLRRIAKGLSPAAQVQQTAQVQLILKSANKTIACMFMKPILGFSTLLLVVLIFGWYNKR